MDHVIVFREAGLSQHLRKFTESYTPELAEGHARVTPRASTGRRADRGDSGGGWAPSSVPTSRRLNRVELSHSDQLLYCRWIDRRAALSDRGPRRSRRGRQQSLPHGTQITPSTVTCQSAYAEAEDRPSRGGALRSSFREPQSEKPRLHGFSRSAEFGYALALFFAHRRHASRRGVPLLFNGHRYWRRLIRPDCNDDRDRAPRGDARRHARIDLV